jgi:hypothetical protein
MPKLQQWSLTEREGSVQFTSSYKLVKISFFFYWKYYSPFYETTYLKEEVKCT